MAEKLKVLLVDDDERNLARTVPHELKKLDVEATALLPDQVTADHLQDLDLLLVDYDLSLWRNGPQAPARMPRNGLALGATLRSWTPQEEALSSQPSQPSRLTGVALYSANLEELAGGLTLSRREHAVARLRGFEWAFSKKDLAGMEPNPVRVKSLAAAVRSVKAFDSAEDTEREQVLFDSLLSLPAEQVWSDEARRDVRDSHPPTSELFDAAGGLAVLRWLAQRILPYPGVLVDDHHVAALLGVEPAVVRENTDPTSDLGSEIDHCRYQGELEHLMGRRWWRVGIEQKLIEWESSSLPVATEDTVNKIAELVGDDLTPMLGMVACVNDELDPSDELELKMKAVRLRPDDWPVFALPAWASVDTVRENGLVQLVDPADTSLLEE